MTHSHPEAAEYAAHEAELAQPATLTDIRAEFSEGLIARFLDDSGYSSLSDIRRDYSADAIRSMLIRFRAEVRP